MKAANVGRALLVLAGVWVSACGEAPTESDSQGLSSIHQALTCSGGDTDPPELSITDQASAILAVHVRDTLKPVLTLNGEEFVQTQCFLPTDDPSTPDTQPAVDPDPYVDPGATAEDQCYGGLTQQVVSFGEINKQIPGVYSLEYQVRDNAGNWADPITRTVEVVDNISPMLMQRPPIMLWPGNNQMRRVQLAECAVAWDMCDGYLDIHGRAYDLSVTSNSPEHDADDIVIIDNNTFEVRARHSTHGSSRIYTARYKVADSSGNVKEGSCTLYVPQHPNSPAP